MPDRVLLYDGERCSVWMTPKASKAFAKAEPRFRARIMKLMERFAERGHEAFTEEQFKGQGRFGIGDERGRKVMISAFKAFQLRVYGGFIPGTGEFVCTEVVTTKKQDGADSAALERAATNLGKFVIREKGVEPMRRAFGPKNEQERLVFAIEELRADVQLTIQEVMHCKGITRSHLAKLLGCSPARVTQVLGEDGNPTIETIAQVFYALGDTCSFESALLKRRVAQKGRVVRNEEPDDHERDYRRGTSGGDRPRKERRPQPTTQMVMQVAQDAMRRQAWGPAHNQNLIHQMPQAA
jgi:transcriptional regulator with XRE-family HTH domain